MIFRKVQAYLLTYVLNYYYIRLMMDTVILGRLCPSKYTIFAISSLFRTDLHQDLIQKYKEIEQVGLWQRYLHPRRGAQCGNIKGYSAAQFYVVNLMIFQPFLLQHTQKSIKLHNFLMKLSRRFLTRLVVCKKFQ